MQDLYSRMKLSAVRFLRNISQLSRKVSKKLCRTVYWLVTLLLILLDFAVLCDRPDPRKYDFLLFPEGDLWGLVLPEGDPLAQKETILADDLIGLPLFTSQQGWEGDIRAWAGERFAQMHLEGSSRLAYNASLFVREGLGYQLTFRHLVDTSAESGLVFRPLSPPLEVSLYLIWNRYQAFTPMVERFLNQVRVSFQAQRQT